MPKRAWLVELVMVLAIALVAMGTFFLAFGLSFRFDIPIRYLGRRYFGDFIFLAAQVKGLVENGWFFFNPALGAPFGLQFQDFPMGENLTWGMLKLISLGTADPVTIVNICYFLTYPLAASTAYLTGRALGFARPTSFVLGLLFAFLPFHQAKGTFHFSQSTFYPLPLMTLVFLWIHQGGKVGTAAFSQGEKSNFWTWKRLLLAVFFSVLVASTNLYFTFFSCYFLLLAGTRAYFTRKDKHSLGASLLLILVLVIVPVLHNLPTIIFRYQHGSNAEVGVRYPAESEMFALRISQLLLPHWQHRLTSFQGMRERFVQAYPEVNFNNEEIVSSSLGTAATLGFLYLLAEMLFFRRGRGDDPPSRNPMIFDLFLLVLAGLLLGIPGGIGTLFNAFITPTFRCYNRLSPFIAIFSLLALASLLDRCVAHWTGKNQGWKGWGVATVLVVVGIWDQTYAENQPVREHEVDAGYVRSLEETLPVGAMIFQLPIVPFPENGPVHDLADYDHLRGYLHSKNLRWSYGCMRGREGDAWQRQLQKMPLDEMLKVVQEKGFAGIWVDLAGYSHKDFSIPFMVETLGRPLVHPAGRILFFRFVGKKADQ